MSSGVSHTLNRVGEPLGAAIFAVNDSNSSWRCPDCV